MRLGTVLFLAAACAGGPRSTWDSPAGDTRVTQDSTQDEVLIIRGIFNPQGDTLLRLSPVARRKWRTGTFPDQKTGRFAVRVTFASGETTVVPFDALVSADVPDGTRHGFFEVVVPVRGEVRAIRITDAKDEKVFAQLTGSDIPA